jgi:hypothetical protein
MAFLFTQPLKTIYNTNHPNAYAKISTYTVDVLIERIRVNVSIFANQEARLIGAQPINIKTLTFTGKAYDKLQWVSLQDMGIQDRSGDPLQGGIISLYQLQLEQIYKLLSTTPDFASADRVIEEMIIDHGEIKAGEEISLKFADDNKLREGIDYTKVISTLKTE